MKKKRICKRCKKEYHPTAQGQKYCGKQKDKGSCSYLVNKDKHEEFIKNNKEKVIAYHRKYWDRFKKDIEKYTNYLLERKAQYLRFRFKIFARDNFTCQYCGRKAPDIELQIDHIFPKSKGGKKTMENSKTICKECNLGKGDLILIREKK